MTNLEGDELTALMRLAFEGDREAAEKFFTLLFNTHLAVPARKQAHPLSDSPIYPNELIDILGVQAGERVIVPVFSRDDLIQEWCGTTLKSRSMSLVDILRILPEEWWLILNPGQEVEKEFSPWELAHLRNGSEGVPALLHDLEQINDERSAQVFPLEKDEYLPLKAAIVEFGKSHPDITSIFALKEERNEPDSDHSGDASRVVLLALEGTMSPALGESYREELASLAAKAMIGEIPVRVVPPTSAGNAFLHGVFRHYEPTYQSQHTKSKILKMFQRWLTRS